MATASLAKVCLCACHPVFKRCAGVPFNHDRNPGGPSDFLHLGAHQTAIQVALKASPTSTEGVLGVSPPVPQQVVDRHPPGRKHTDGSVQDNSDFDIANNRANSTNHTYAHSVYTDPWVNTLFAYVTHENWWQHCSDQVQVVLYSSQPASLILFRMRCSVNKGQNSFNSATWQRIWTTNLPHAQHGCFRGSRPCDYLSWQAVPGYTIGSHCTCTQLCTYVCMQVCICAS